MLLVLLGCGEIVEESFGGGELLLWPTTEESGQGEIQVPGLTQAQLDGDEEKPASYAWVSGVDDHGFSVNVLLGEGELDPWLACGAQAAFVEGVVYEERTWFDGELTRDEASGDVRGWSGATSYGPDTTRLEGSATTVLETEVDLDEACDDVTYTLDLSLAWAFDRDVRTRRRATPDAFALELDGLTFSW